VERYFGLGFFFFRLGAFIIFQLYLTILGQTRILRQVAVGLDPKTMVGTQGIEENQICGN